MSAVREWSTVICLAALAAALLQSLVPNGSMERMAKFVIGAFFICVIILPLSKAVPQMKLRLNRSSSSVQNDRLETTVESQIRSESQKSISNLVTAELSRIHIKCKNVHVDMDTDANGSISITKVTVTLGKKYAAQCQTAADYLEKELGIKTEVVSDGS